MTPLRSALLRASLLALALPVRALAQAPAPSPSPSPSPSPAPAPPATAVPIPSEDPPVSDWEPMAGGRPVPSSLAPPAVGQTGIRLPAWLVTFRLRETYEDNPLFEEGGAEEDTFIDNAAVSLARTFRGSRGFATLFGSGNGTRYHSDSDLNRFGWGAGVAVSQRLAPRTTFVLGQEVVSAYTRDAALLSGGAVLLPLAWTLSSHGAAEISHQTSARTSLAANVRYDRVDFPDEELPDGSELAVGARFTTRVSATDGIDLVYVHQRNMLGSDMQPAHSVHAAWTGTRGTNFAFGLGAGATYLPATELTEDEVAPFGFAEGNLRGRRGALSVRYSRSVSQAFGLGRVREGDLVSVGVTQALATWVSVFGHYGYGLSHDVFDPTFEYEAQGYEGGLRFSLGGGLGLTAAYGRRQSSTGDAPAVESAAAHLSLTYSKGF
jgi:hypothetical protein